MRSCIKSVSALVVMMSMCILSSEIKAAPAKATEPLGTVMDVVSRIEKLQTLSKAIKVADMAESLGHMQNITLFAPTNAAFAQWPDEELGRLFQNKAALTTLIEFHISEERISSKQAEQMDYVMTLLGKLASLDYDGTHLMIDDAEIIFRDIPASNGVIHFIDTVLEP
jgi:uncharacterized surface protein with fasciclin (FAS1) repeats